MSTYMLKCATVLLRSKNIEELSDVIDPNKNRDWMEAKSKLKLFTQKLNDLVTESKETEV